MRSYTKTLLAFAMILSGGVAQAGRGASTPGLKSAVLSGSEDAIVSEIERAEWLACTSCIAPIRALVDSDSQKVRDAAGWWLGKRGVRDEVIATMTARFSAQDPIAARNAADVLRAMRDYNTLPALAAYVQHPLDEESGAAAVRAIAAIGHPSSVGVLTGAFGSSLAGVRAAAAAAVRDLRAPIGKKTATDAQPLLPLLADANEGVRREAAMSAGFLQDRAAVSALAGLVASDSSAKVRKAAAWALGEIGDGAGVAALTTAQNDADALVRSVATGALHRLK
jgi:HEAT repeat protein